MDGEIYVWQFCVEIEGYSVKSSLPHSKCRIAELLFLVSLSSGRVSAPRSRVLFHCEVACLSLAVWVACLARHLSLRFLAPLFRSLDFCSTSSSVSFLGRLRSSCYCASLRALLELVWVSMSNKGCSLKRFRE